MTLKEEFAMGGRKGSILILVLWVLLLLSTFSVAVGYAVRQRLELVQRLEIRDQLRFIAEAGFKSALHAIQVQPEAWPESLKDNWASNASAFRDRELGAGIFSVSYPIVDKQVTSTLEEQSFRYGAVDEESKINVNLVESPEILTRLIQSAASLNKDDAYALAVSMLDWIDDDEFSYDSGAESRYYKQLAVPYLAQNSRIDVFGELLYVKGMTPELLERITPYISLHGSGAVNVNTASGMVLSAIGFHNPVVDKIVAYRSGYDKLEGTLDDNIFQEKSAILETLNQYSALSESEIQNVTDLLEKNRVDVQSSFFRIRSSGRLKHRKEMLTIEGVVSRAGEIKTWSERFHQYRLGRN